MDIQKRIAEIEAGLKALGVARSEFFTLAGLHHDSWRRWKTGELPTLRKWQRAEGAFAELSRASAAPISA